MTGGSCSGRVATLWERGEKASRVLTIRRRSRPDPGNERRELQAEAQRGEPFLASTCPSRRRIDRTVNSLSSCSCNLATLIEQLPPVLTSVVHDSSATVVYEVAAIDKT